MSPHAPPTAAQADALLTGALRGDRRAARDLTERILLPVLDAAVSRMLAGARGQRFEKSDVVQEVFQHLYQDGWRRLRSYDSNRGSLAGYVWAIADKWLRDHGRRLPPPRATEDMDAERSPDSGPERRAALGEVIDRVQRALTTEETALFQWIYFEGASHTAAAERLGIAVEAVHKRVQRLETKVRAAAADETPGQMARGGHP